MASPRRPERQKGLKYSLGLPTIFGKNAQICEVLRELKNVTSSLQLRGKYILHLNKYLFFKSSVEIENLKFD